MNFKNPGAAVAAPGAEAHVYFLWASFSVVPDVRKNLVQLLRRPVEVLAIIPRRIQQLPGVHSVQFPNNARHCDLMYFRSDLPVMLLECFRSKDMDFRVFAHVQPLRVGANKLLLRQFNTFRREDARR